MNSSRRRFLQSAGIAATVAAAQPAALLGQSSDTDKKLTAPIAKLKSRKAEAKPITAEERQQRLDRARQLMAENKLDAMMLIGGTGTIWPAKPDKDEICRSLRSASNSISTARASW